MKRIFLGLSALIFIAIAGCNQGASNNTDSDNAASVPPKEMDSTKVVKAPENITEPGKTALQTPKTSAKPVAPKAATSPTKPLKVNWQPSLAAAFKEADKTGKPIMADFYAVWCGPCKILDEYVYPSADFAKVAQDWVVVKIDAEKETELAQKYAIQAFPTTIFFKSDGSIFERQEGFAASSNDPASVGVEFRTQLVDMMKNYRDQAGRSRSANVSTHIHPIS